VVDHWLGHAWHSINYLPRATLSVAAPTLTEELALTTKQYSYVVMAFQAAYTIMQTVAGAFWMPWAQGSAFSFLPSDGRWQIWRTGWQGLAFFLGLLGATGRFARRGDGMP
jgi:MFS transporter, ACS family, hexuronate transporter